MKTFLKPTALFMAFIMLMTSCYSTRINTSTNSQDELKEYITGLEPGNRIRIISKYDGKKINIQYIGMDGNAIKGIETNQDKKMIRTVEISDISKIDTINGGKTFFAILGGTLIFLLFIAIIDFLANGFDMGWSGPLV